VGWGSVCSAFSRPRNAKLEAAIGIVLQLSAARVVSDTS
jgi:hypothetical protein